MSTAHTTGPWLDEENPTIGEGRQVAAFSEDGNRVLQVTVRSFNPEADRRLIAAAPELLEALRVAAVVLERTSNDTLDGRNAALAARSAINKATGNAP